MAPPPKRVKKVMTLPINVIFTHLQVRSLVRRHVGFCVFFVFFVVSIFTFFEMDRTPERPLFRFLDLVIVVVETTFCVYDCLR